MSDSGEGVDLTNEILREILDLLRQKTDPENAQKLHEGPQHSDDTVLEANVNSQEPLITDTAILETVNDTASAETASNNDWPNDETIARYRDRCARHKSECEKMQVELGCFVAHSSIVRGNKDIIRYADELRNGMLGHIQYLKKALGVTPDESGDAMGKVNDSFYRLWDLLWDFRRCLRHEDALYPDMVKQWRSIARNGYNKTSELIREGKYVKCLEFIHDKLFTDMETAMSGVAEALTEFTENSATELLAMQKIADFERWCNDYISHVLPPADAIRAPGTWPEPDEIQKFKQRLTEHKKLSNEMQGELDHLVSHYTIIEGDKVVVEATKSLKEAMLSYFQYLESAADEQPRDFRTEMSDVIKILLFAVICFHNSLYHQKHAFYFRKVKEWVNYTWIGTLRILRLLHRGEVSECIAYIHYTFLSEFEQAMTGIAHGNQAKPGESSTNGVPEELKTFGKESLPKFLVDEMERDTTRYVNLTTIAAFFSSVTATTLQFTYAPLQMEASDSLRGVVNLFWFLSLVFSVSSGVNSLLGLTWRKSSIYDSRAPPKLIRIWFDKAPMLFLIIAAIAFVIGLNLFAYLSVQPRFVSLATNILTGLHGMCLLAVTLWFLYQLKIDSVWAGWIKIVTEPLTRIADWIIVKATEWIRKGAKCIKTGSKCIWKMAKWPYIWFKQNLHLQRNIFWAFAIDNCVARLNNDIMTDWLQARNWSEPYPLSKLMRCIAYPVKKCWLKSNKTLCDLSISVQKHISASSRTENTEGVIELGERERRDDSEVSDESLPESPTEKVKDEFCRSLQKIFSEARWVDSIMDDVESGSQLFGVREVEIAEQSIGRKLWGYPDLVREFRDSVRPTLIEARDERRDERRRGMLTEHVSGSDSVAAPTVVGQDAGQDESEDDTADVLPQSRQTTPLDDGSGPSDSRKTDDQRDSPVHQDYRPPADGHSLITALASTEALEPTFGDPHLPLNTSGVGEEPTLSNEIVEVTSISKN